MVFGSGTFEEPFREVSIQRICDFKKSWLRPLSEQKVEQVLRTCCGFSEPSVGSENLAGVLRTLVGFSELWVPQKVWQGRSF